MLKDLRNQRILSTFPWMRARSDANLSATSGWSVDFKEVVNRADLSLDPKRWSQRYADIRAAINDREHFDLGDVVELIEEEGVPDTPAKTFQYVESQDVSDGLVTPTRRRGWELPSRARHQALAGDIFVGGVWGSVSKWFIAGGDCSNLIASNGFKRLRLKAGCSKYLTDIVAGLVSESYLVQARALCTGSDGLAELNDGDVLKIVFPIIQDPDARVAVQGIVEALLTGRATVSSVVLQLQADGKIHPPPVNVRGSNFVQV